MKRRKNLYFEIEVPNEIKCKIEENYIFLKKEDDELKRKLNPLVDVGIKDNKIFVKTENPTRREKKIFGTTKAHIKNMVSGLKQKFEYKLQICSVHFPMMVNFDDKERILTIKNFVGEKSDRKIKR